MQTMSQLDAILSGSPGSSRSARPLLCTTDIAVAAALRSTRQFTQGASHPSPSSARVPTSSLVEPAVKMLVASSTHSRGCHPAPLAASRTRSSPGSACQPPTAGPAAAASAASSVSASPAAQRRPRPETSSGRSAAVRGSAASVRTASGAEPASACSTPDSDAAGTVRTALLRSAAIRCRAPADSRSPSRRLPWLIRAISRFSVAVMRATSRLRRAAASPVQASASRPAAAAVVPVACARCAAQRRSARSPSPAAGSSSWQSA
jgi:hypothetical protein